MISANKNLLQWAPIKGGWSINRCKFPQKNTVDMTLASSVVATSLVPSQQMYQEDLYYKALLFIYFLPLSWRRCFSYSCVLCSQLAVAGFLFVYLLLILLPPLSPPCAPVTSTVPPFSSPRVLSFNPLSLSPPLILLSLFDPRPLDTPISPIPLIWLSDSHQFTFHPPHLSFSSSPSL